MSLTMTLKRGGGTASGTGTNITLAGTMDGGAIESVEMNGDTTQQTYSGKNLLNVTKGTFTQNGITFTQNPDGSVTMNGTSTGNAYYEMNNTAASQTTITSGVRYTLSIGNVTLPSGQVIVQLRKVNPNTVYCAVNDKSASFTAPETTTTFTYIGVYGSGVTLNNVTIYPMLEVGSSMTSFEPYVGGTASPNPDYPQEVQTVTGRQVVTISDGGSQSQEYEVNLGKNLLKNLQSAYINATDNGITNTLNEDGSLTCSGTVGSGWNGWTISNYVDNNLPAGTYTFSIDQTIGYTINVTFRDSSNTNIVAAAISSGSKSATVDVSRPIAKISFWVNATIGSAINFTIKPQIEKGSTATTYAPYFTPIELCKIGDYQDYIYKSGEDWYVHKETGKYRLESAKAQSAYYGRYRYAKSDIPSQNIPSGSLDFCMEYFTIVATDTSGIGSVYAGNTMLNFKYDANGDNLAGFQTWLTNNTVNIYYPLATPTDTQITNSALISELDSLISTTTYDNTTYITVSGDLASPLKVVADKYITKTYTEVELGSPFTIADVEGKSSNTTLDGNVYVDWAYNKKQYSFDLFNLTPQDYADIRAFYDYQFNNSAFPTITVPELNIDKLPVYMEISSRNIINQCLLTDKLTIKFRETVQP